jgi:hypothetical protein
VGLRLTCPRISSTEPDGSVEQEKGDYNIKMSSFVYFFSVAKMDVQWIAWFLLKQKSVRSGKIKSQTPRPLHPLFLQAFLYRRCGQVCTRCHAGSCAEALEEGYDELRYEVMPQ